MGRQGRVLGDFCMVSANYGRFRVTVLHNGQLQSAILHVIEASSNQHQFFLFDSFGWAIDTKRAVDAARAQYALGTAEEIATF